MGIITNGFGRMALWGIVLASAYVNNAAALQVEILRSTKKDTFLGMGDPKVVQERVVLQKFSPEDLKKRKSLELQEMDPESRSKARFQGASFSDLVIEVMGKLTAEERAHIDLLILEGDSDRVAYMPKAFVVKYPTIQLALKRDGKDLGTAAPRVVLPATTNAKIQKESLILEPLFISSLKSVVLTSYEDRFGNFLLKRRTDPAAMRGEKLFLQNCVGCHGGPAAGSGITQKLTKIQNGGHPEVPKVGPIPTRLQKKDVRSLTSYLDAFSVQADSR